MLLAVLKPVLVVIFALLIDRTFGEPRIHPLVWFGNATSRIERWFNANQDGNVLSGVVATMILVVPPVALIAFIDRQFSSVTTLSILFETIVLWFVIGWQSLQQHARAISTPLIEGNLDAARVQLAKIVSRDTKNLSEEKVVASTVESVLENGHDSLFASIFWYAFLGPAGALLHRLINTLDAMWGYRTERYERFGKFAARMDDVLGFLSARLTAFGYAIFGTTQSAFRCWTSQAGLHQSPNAGVVMAVGAGALATKIGGPTIYNGALKDKPWLGIGEAAITADIERAITLVGNSLTLWLPLIALVALLKLVVSI